MVRTTSVFWLLATIVLAACGGDDDAGLGTGGTAGSMGGGAGSLGGSAGSTGGGAGTSTAGSAGTATGGSAGSATGGSAGSATGGSAGSATGGSAGSATGGSAGSATGGSAGSATGGSAGSATGGSAGSAGATYTIGGTVVGLLGSNLVLQNNAGDNLPIAQNGPFTFPTPIPTGQGYAVSVLSDPASPAQKCTVNAATGSVGTQNVVDVGVVCKLIDSDNDTVPDEADPFPNDSTKPQIAQPKRVYPHTSSKLFTMDVDTLQIAEVGTFKGTTFSGQMTDLAIDQFGVIYGVTFGDLYTCDSATATCYELATLPTSFNGLTMLPPGTLHPYLDTLIGIANSGAWYEVTLTGSGAAQLTVIGSYGGGYTSSGDAFAIEGVGTFASVDKPGQSSDVIVSVNPNTGAVLNEVGPVTGYSLLYGLAGWQGVVFGFDESGAVLSIDIGTGAATLITQTNNAWWGAGVATRLSN